MSPQRYHFDALLDPGGPQMIGDLTVLALIPARAGSKGLPDKNVKSLCGSPLISWTIKKAQLSRHIDRIVVSTDSEQIASIGRSLGADVPFVRPAEFATDEATTFDVAQHCLTFLKQTDGVEFDILVILEPTSPLREDDDLDNMLEKMHNQYEGTDAVISIGEISEHPAILRKIDGERLAPFDRNLNLASRRQDYDPVYFPYGVAYMIKVDALLREKTFYPSRSSYFILKRYQCYEIDDIYDFLAIENIMRHEWQLT